MRDAIGGVVNLVIIVVFLVIVSGYLAFNVNYTKAFRVKNKIISTYEQYEGNCGKGAGNTPCENIIRNYMERLGYDQTVKIKIDGADCKYGFCAQEVVANPGTTLEKTKVYYRITTQITIGIPIINNIMNGNSTFQITGDTKTFTKR